MRGEKWEKYGGEYLFGDWGVWGFEDLLKSLSIDGLVKGDGQSCNKWVAPITPKAIVAPVAHSLRKERDDRLKY